MPSRSSVSASARDSASRKDGIVRLFLSSVFCRPFSTRFAEKARISQPIRKPRIDAATSRDKTCIIRYVMVSVTALFVYKGGKLGICFLSKYALGSQKVYLGPAVLCTSFNGVVTGDRTEFSISVGTDETLIDTIVQ